jgi:hypothetical protein
MHFYFDSLSEINLVVMLANQDSWNPANYTADKLSTLCSQKSAFGFFWTESCLASFGRFWLLFQRHLAPSMRKNVPTLLLPFVWSTWNDRCFERRLVVAMNLLKKGFFKKHQRGAEFQTQTTNLQYNRQFTCWSLLTLSPRSSCIKDSDHFIKSTIYLTSVQIKCCTMRWYNFVLNRLRFSSTCIM